MKKKVHITEMEILKYLLQIFVILYLHTNMNIKQTHTHTYCIDLVFTALLPWKRRSH